MYEQTVPTYHSTIQCDIRGINQDDINEICSQIKGIYQRPQEFIKKTKSGINLCVVFFDNLLECTRVIVTAYIVEWYRLID